MEAVSASGQWYFDPTGRYTWRYWDIGGWTRWVSDGDRPIEDTRCDLDEVAHLAYLRAFIDQAAAEQVISQRARQALHRRASGLVAPPRRSAPTSARPVMPWVVPGAADAPRRPPPTAVRPTAAVRPSPRLVEPVERQPVASLTAPARRTWTRLTNAIAGDLAVHGLAYLGVLLLFAGIFGLVVFAFGDVAPAWRPAAEVAAPAALFGSAAFLRGRGAPFVGNALVVLAGAVVPIVLMASMSDGFSVPPDLDGLPLVAVLSSGCLFVAATYAFVSMRDGESPLRFLIMPMMWLAIAMAALATLHDIPTGRDLATPHALQMAIVAASIVATTALVRFKWPRGGFADQLELAAGIGFGVVYTLALLSAAVEGWPPIPLGLTGLVGVVLLEVVAHRLDRRVAGVGQAVLLAAAVLPFVQSFGAASTAAGAVVGELVLAEWTGWRRPSSVACAVAIGGAAVAASFTLAQPWPALVAGSVLWCWLVFRRHRRPEWLATVDDAVFISGLIVTAIAPAAAVFQLLTVDAALLVLAGAVAIIGSVARPLARRNDVFWQWWPRGALVVVGLGTGVAATEGSTSTLLAAAIIVAYGLAVAPGPFVVAFWSTAAATVWAALLAADLADLGVATTAVALAVVGFALVGMSDSTRAAVHLGLLGHALGLAALVGAVPADWSAVAVEGAFAAGWGLTLVREELGRCALIDAFRSTVDGQRPAPIDTVRWVPAVMAELAVSLLAIGVLRAADVDPSWWGPVLAATGAAECAFSRWAEARGRLARVAAIGGLVTTVIAVSVLTAGVGRITITLSAAILAVAVLPTALRPLVAVWWAVGLSAAASMTSALWLGLDADRTFGVLMVWGATMLVGAVALDRRRAGPRNTSEIVRDRRLLAPIVFGTIGLATGQAIAFTHTPDVFGSWSFFVATVALVVAFQLRAGSVSAVTYAFFGIGFGAWLPFNAVELPWTIVVFACALAIWSVVLSRVVGATSAFDRWDVAPLAVANVSVVVALFASADQGYVPATFLLSSLVFVLMVIVLHNALWFAVADGLALVGLAALGLGWLTVGFAANSVTATGLAMRARDDVARVALRGFGAIAATATWFTALAWVDLAQRDAAIASAVMAGLVVVTLAMAIRGRVLSVEWAWPWLAPAAAGMWWPAMLLSNTESAALRDDLLIGFGIALGLWAVAAALAAAPLRAEWMRYLTIALAGVSGSCVAAGREATLEQVAWSVMAVGFAATAATLFVVTVRPRSPWLSPTLAASALATLVSISVSTVGSFSGPLEHYLPETALLTAAVEAAAAGAVLANAAVLALSPPFACAAWLIFAFDAFAGEPMWFGIPVGVSLLVDTGLIRWRRRTDGLPVSTPTIVAMDDIGMMFVLGTPLIETVVVSSLDALIALTCGIVVAMWGVVTKVRRRALAGAAGVVLATLLLIALPLVPLIPEITGPTLWVTVAAAGLLAILAAASVEQGRARLHHGVEHLESLTRDWE